MTVASTTVVAAGAVLFRFVDGKARVLLIHRDHHGDVSLPKGKVDPGESTPQAAVREIREETGYRVALGAPLGHVEYVMPGGRDKIVHYWAAEVTDEAFVAAGDFTPNSEVGAIEWVGIDKARAKLTYERDADVLARFADRVAAKHARTFALVALRHAKTTAPGDWSGSDATRPLLPAGRRQAKSIAPGSPPGRRSGSSAARPPAASPRSSPSRRSPASGSSRPTPSARTLTSTAQTTSRASSRSVSRSAPVRCSAATGPCCPS